MLQILQKNIEHAIKNLLFFVTASASTEEYKNYKELFNNVLVKINKALPVYFKTGSLKNIDKDDLQDIMYDLLDLEVATQLMNSYYAERAFLWIEAIITLRQAEINLGDIINVK